MRDAGGRYALVLEERGEDRSFQLNASLKVPSVAGHEDKSLSCRALSSLTVDSGAEITPPQPATQRASKSFMSEIRLPMRRR